MPDETKNPRGGSTVPYWSVDDVDAVRQRLLDAGCTHHRGPLQVVPGRKTCQGLIPSASLSVWTVRSYGGRFALRRGL